jgi:hypothetical protein
MPFLCNLESDGHCVKNRTVFGVFNYLISNLIHVAGASSPKAPLGLDLR